MAVQKLNPQKSKKEADYLFNLGSYYNAVDYYQVMLKKTPDAEYPNYQMGMSELYLRDYAQAENYFKKLVDANAVNYPLAKYYYGLALKYNGKYDLAKTAFDDFTSNLKDTRDNEFAPYKKRAQTESKGCDLALKLLQKPDSVKIIHLNESVNNPFSDYAPVSLGDSALLFASLKSDSAIVVDAMQKDGQYSEFYEAKKVGNNFQKAVAFPGPFNSDQQHTGNGAFSPDRKRFYFTKCDLGAGMKMKCNIYMSEYQNGVWSDPDSLDKNVNYPDANNTEPAVGRSSTGDILYWASDRPGGSGGLDIWMSAFENKTGKFSTAVNLGRNINTKGDEITPFFDIKTSTLYFSSNDLIGIGGFDIYKTRFTDKKWTDPVNAGVPLNSSVDDMYYVIDENQHSGYLVSNRPGTIALKSETCCDDIWSVEYPNVIRYVVRGNVYDAEKRQPLAGAKVFLVDDHQKQVGAAMISKADSLYYFNLQPKKFYTLKSVKQGYLTGSADFTVAERDYSDTMRIDLLMKKITSQPVRIQNVFYDFAKATLRPESLPPLDTLVTLLKDNPGIIVEIASHTDSKGTLKYNQKLSLSRAQSVVNYLESKGVTSDRLIAKGYGPTQPVAPNKLKNGKDNPEGRALNRRTEFKIVGSIPGRELIYQQGNPSEDQKNQ
ncbi:MAG: OmpA family protein [Chitinophagales bacterium]|nr:OmpA family protein [Chitinophagales bacterium]